MMSDHDKAFFGGLCCALQIVALYDYGTVWRDIVNAAGYEDVKKYVTKIEPEEFELISFGKYSKSEFGKRVRRPKLRVREL